MDITITQASLLTLLFFGWLIAAVTVYSYRSGERPHFWFGLTMLSIVVLGLVFTIYDLWRVKRIFLTPSNIRLLVVMIANVHIISTAVWFKSQVRPDGTEPWWAILAFRPPPAAAVLAPKKPTWPERLYITFAQLCVTVLLSFAAYCLLAVGPQPCSWPDHLLGGPSGCVETVRPSPLFGKTPEKIARSPDGSLLAVASINAPVDILRRDGARLHRLPHNGWVRAVVFSPDSALLATSDQNALRIWSVPSHSLLHNIPSDGPNEALAFTPDGTLLLGDAGDGRVSAWRVADGTLARTFETEVADALIEALAVSPDGTRVAAALDNGKTDEIRVWRWSDGAVLHRLAEWSATELAFAPDSRTLAAALWQNEVAIWDLSSGQQRYNLASAEGIAVRVHALDFAPDGATVAAGFSDGTIQIWRTADGRPLHTFRYTNSVEDLVFDRDGRLILSANDDDSIRAWRLPR
ncbi:MAG TPA: hypothetical protein VFS21_16455 [Roseiflexaceae bacterium]|nr:hypothetical protein [Roseiflexaceae bacterium]